MADNAKMRELKDRAGEVYFFERVHLRFADSTESDVFSHKNNKTLGETLKHRRYAALERSAMRYADRMDMLLGEFLLMLKRDGDPFYKQFLNDYGDLRYSRFEIDDPEMFAKKGVYAWYVADGLRYIGRCKDSMKKRINQGYGKIHPKNCYRDGQSTNCHMNALITEAEDMVSLWLCPLERDGEIESVERQLIGAHNPPWNIQGC